jgi:hypothetical protein
VTDADGGNHFSISCLVDVGETMGWIECISPEIDNTRYKE